VASLVATWQRDQKPEVLDQILEAARPAITGTLLTRGFAADFEELLNSARVKIWKKLPKFDPSRGRCFTFFSMLASQAASEAWAKKRIHSERYNLNCVEVLDSLKHSAWSRITQADIYEDFWHRVSQVRVPCDDERERESLRWLKKGQFDAEFRLKRHQAADSMSLVFEISPKRARELYDLGVLETRRALIPLLAEVPTITRRDLIGTRGRALGRYCDLLPAQDFAKLAFLMRGLAPKIIPKPDRLDLILDGFPDAQPLFPSESGSRVEQ
jgi:hypothetical protein